MPQPESKTFAQHTRGAALAARQFIRRQPWLASACLLVAGLSGGAGAMQLVSTDAEAKAQQAALSKDAAQRELNAMAARLAELQAETTRLNALGQRLARDAELPEGEFDFAKPVGQGGGGPVHDIAPADLERGISQLDAQLRTSGGQLSGLESLLFNRQRDRAALPSGTPVVGSYITSTFGLRADPFGAGGQFHKGIDYAANLGDPVLAVADGVVTFAGDRSGYGHTIEVDHGNGYVTRYAHNSRLSRRVGELVRAGGEVAKAGSTGRSTGVHVHLEVWQNGAYVDPGRFLNTHKPTRG